MQGQRGLSTNSSEYNAQDFMISQMLGRIATWNDFAWSPSPAQASPRWASSTCSLSSTS